MYTAFHLQKKEKQADYKNQDNRVILTRNYDYIDCDVPLMIQLSVHSLELLLNLSTDMASFLMHP